MLNYSQLSISKGVVILDSWYKTLPDILIRVGILVVEQFSVNNFFAHWYHRSFKSISLADNGLECLRSNEYMW